MLKDGPFVLSGSVKQQMPQCIPIKINKDFLGLIERGVDLKLEIKEGKMEIHANDEVITLKSMGTPGENEMLYREGRNNTLEFVGFSGAKVSMPPKVNRLKQIGKEEKAAKDERKSILLDDFQISKKKSTARTKKSILVQNHSLHKHTRSISPSRPRTISNPTSTRERNPSPMGRVAKNMNSPKGNGVASPGIARTVSLHSSQGAVTPTASLLGLPNTTVASPSVSTPNTSSSNGAGKSLPNHSTSNGAGKSLPNHAPTHQSSHGAGKSIPLHSSNGAGKTIPASTKATAGKTIAKPTTTSSANSAKSAVTGNTSFFKALSNPSVKEFKRGHSRTASDSGLTFRNSSSENTSETLKLQLIHYLACAPHEIKECCAKTGSPEDLITEILRDIGTPQASNPNCFQLRSECYKLLRPWDWKEYSKTERDRAIKNASIAFDLLKIPKNDDVRRNLSPSSKSSEKRKSSDEEFGVKKVKVEAGPVKIDRIKLKMNVKPATAVKPNGPDKMVNGSPDSEGKKSISSDQSLKRKGEDELSVGGNEKKAKVEVEGKSKFEGGVSKADRIKLIQTPKKANGDGKVSDTKPQSQPNKRPGQPKRRERKDWDLMSKVELEVYSAWLVSQKLYLQGKMDLIQKVTKNLSLNLFGMERESERMSLIRSNLKVKGFSTDPGLFLAQAKANVELFNQISKELMDFEKYIVDCGGKFEYEIE